MQDNSGSILKLWVLDASSILDINISPNPLSNSIQLADTVELFPIPLVQDSGSVDLKTDTSKPGKPISFLLKCLVAVNDANIQLINKLPANKAVIYKDAEQRYRFFGSKDEPLVFYSVEKTDPDFNEGKFFELEFKREITQSGYFIINPFAELPEGTY